MAELTWKEAIVKVLEEEKKSLHYTDIAQLISQRGYRKSLGATPAATVIAQLSVDIKQNKEKSIFARVDAGTFILRKFLDDEALLLTEETTTADKTPNYPTEIFRVINSYGIYWNRNLVYWKNNPDLLGKQQYGATSVNFKEQIGIYLLHDRREIIYIGQAVDQPLGQRLKTHINDRLSGRWDRFSWFGFYPVNNSGKLHTDFKFDDLTVQDLGNVLEAILIESIEPRQNRKGGNLFSGIEYLQQEAPEINKKRKEELIRELTEKL